MTLKATKKEEKQQTMSPSNLNMVLSRTTLYVLIVTTAFFETAFSQECWERDEVAAGRKCKRACHPDGSCRKKNKECVCDGFCGPSCFYKRCPPLTEPMNGNIIINPTDRTIGAEVTYSCNNGYVISGRPTRVCQANKTWSGTEPTCTESTTTVRQVCPVRDEVAAGRNCERACQPDNTCRKQNRECVCDGLCGLTCFKKRCPPLTPIQNGNLVIEPEVRTIGSEVTYSCNSGFVLSGRRNRQCRANKRWSGTQPACIQSSPSSQSTNDGLCPRLELNGGTLEYRDGNNRIVDQPLHGNTRIAMCSEGYVLNGIAQSLCSFGVWQEELPNCERASCKTLDLEDGGLAYLNENNEEIFEPKHGDIRVAFCNDGRILRGASQTQCIFGSWQNELPSCEIDQVRCHQPPEAENAAHNGTKAYFLDGDIVIYRCDYGYSRTGSLPLSRCNGGEWSEIQFQCSLIQCNRPDEPTNGHSDADVESYGYEGTVSFDCDPGYVLKGSSIITCNEHGRWSPPPPLCLGSCNKDDLLDGEWEWEIQYTNLGGRDELDRLASPDTIATIECNTFGYETTGDNTRTCRRGEWSGENPSCVRVQCQAFQLTNGGVTYFGNDNRERLIPRHGDFLRPICNRGYAVQGPAQTQCRNGQWDIEVPICVERLCTAVTLNNGRVQYRNSNNEAILVPRHGDYMIASCNEGHTLQGTSTIHCLEGNWVNDRPTCKERCSSGCQVPEIEDGYFTPYQSVSRFQPMDCVEPGSHIYVRCQEPLHYRGAHAYTCQSSGQWFTDGEFATCHRCSVNRCIIPHIENGYFSTSQYGSDPRPTGTCVDSESYLYPRCLLGAELVGASRFYCRDGKFMILSNDRRSPVCTEEPRCGRPDVHSLPTHIGNELTLSRHHQDFIQGTTLTSRCHNPLRQRIRGGSVTRRCEGGRWTGAPLQCESTYFEFSITNTVIQNITENGTLVVYPVDGYVNINCNFLLSSTSLVSLHQETMSASGSLGRGNGRITYRLPDPSPQNSGRYLCETNGRRHSINVLFQAITCSPPTQPNGGYWRHNRQRANKDGSLGYIFTETLSLICPNGYSSTNPAQPTCTHHGTWSNMPQRCTHN